VLGLVLQTKFHENFKVWEAGAAAFCSVVTAGLSSLASPADENAAAQYNLLWGEVCDHIQLSVFKEPRTEFLFVHLVEGLLPIGFHLTYIPERLLGILIATTRTKGQFSSLQRTSWSCLIRLAQSTDLDMAKVVYNLLIGRCAELLSQGESDDFVVVNFMQEEIQFLLQVLTQAEFDPQLAGFPGSPQKQLHLCQLFKVFVKCINVDSKEIRHAVQVILNRVAAQVSLLQ